MNLPRSYLLAIAIGASAVLSVPADEPHPTPPASPDIQDGSLYALDSAWTDQAGRKHEWSAGAGKGKARVLAMGYTYCKGICPRIIADMRRVETKLSAEEKGRTVFTFLSFTPENDTVADLKAFAENHKLLADNWQVMTGKPDGVLEMAVALGIQYTMLPNKVDYAHSYLIAVLDPDGKVIHKWTSPNAGPEQAVKALRAALSGKK